MNVKAIASATAKTLISYLTYQAMRTVHSQLSETDPPRALWLAQFSSMEKMQDGEAYLKELLQANPELAFRMMTVREHLAVEIGEYLPEMMQTGIQQANMQHRRNHLEHITQFTTVEHEDLPSDSDEPPDVDPLVS